MTAWALAYVRRSHSLARLRDFVELTKPRIATLVLVTVAVAAWLAAWGPTDQGVLWHILLGTALVAASGSAMNQWIERRSDARMPRTAGRPLPAGRLSSGEVLLFAALTVLAGIAYLAIVINFRAAATAAITWVLYTLVYTPLKARSIYNTALGAVAGAMPVLIGWSAVGGHFDLLAATLFMIVYLWQFPHFMAIAWIYREDYAAAGLRMLPSVDPSGARTGMQAVVAALVLLPVSLIPAVTHVLPLHFALCTLTLGASYIAAALWFLIHKDDSSARLLLWVSLIYLPSQMGTLALMPLF